MISQRAALRTFQRLAARRATSARGYATEDGGFKLADNAFNRDRAAVKAHAAESAQLWRKLSIFVVLPALAIFSANAYTLWNEHWEHESHRPPPEDRPQYAYLNVRNKPYPWGDGDKTLFWNDNVNYVKKE